MPDHGHFSSYEGDKERQTGKTRGAFSRMQRALDGWILARAPASPAQGLHRHGPRYFNFSYFCTMCGLEKLGLVDQNWLERFSRFFYENAGRGSAATFRVDRSCSRYGVRRFGEPFWYWSVPLLVEPHNVLSRCGSLLV